MKQFEKGLKLLDILSQHGDAYIVGGAVRDKIMGIEPDDIDISTNVPMEKIEELFETHDIGKNKDFGIVCIKYEDEVFEIAQFRNDGVYSDGRRPDSVQFVKTIEEDLARRDFSINAMAMDRDGNIIDPFNGKQAIKDKRVVTVGSPFDRFNEDYLRMLRAIRFAARFDFELCESALYFIKELNEKILDISKERVFKEFWKMASQNGIRFARAIDLMCQTMLLRRLYPEIDVMQQYLHNGKWHPEGGVYDHTLAAVKTYKDNDPTTNISILFHDVGKPMSYEWKQEKHTYYGHENIGYHHLPIIAERMKWPNDLLKACQFATKNHMKFHLFNVMKASKIAGLITDPHWSLLKDVAKADTYSRGQDLGDIDWKIVENRLDKMNTDGITPDQMVKIRKVINGNLVIEETGAKGPMIGTILKKTVQWVVDNKIDLSDIEKIKKHLKTFNFKKD